jgi:hypothetical protein
MITATCGDGGDTIPPPRTMDHLLDMRKEGPGTTLRRATIALAAVAAPGADIITIIIGASDGEDTTLRTMIPMSVGDDPVVTTTVMTIIIVDAAATATATIVESIGRGTAAPADVMTLPMMTIRTREMVGTSPNTDGATIVAAAMIVMKSTASRRRTAKMEAATRCPRVIPLVCKTLPNSARRRP